MRDLAADPNPRLLAERGEGPPSNVSVEAQLAEEAELSFSLETVERATLGAGVVLVATLVLIVALVVGGSVSTEEVAPALARISYTRVQAILDEWTF